VGFVLPAMAATLRRRFEGGPVVFFEHDVEPNHLSARDAASRLRAVLPDEIDSIRHRPRRVGGDAFEHGVEGRHAELAWTTPGL